MSFPRWGFHNNILLSGVILTSSAGGSPSYGDINNNILRLTGGWTNIPWTSIWKTYVIDDNNDAADFTASGAAGTLVASIPHGQYRGKTLANAIAQAMNDAVIAAGGVGNFTCTYAAGIFILSRASGTFVLLKASGGNANIGIWTSIGFRQHADTGSITTYTSDYAVTTTGGTFEVDATNDQLPFAVNGSPFTGTLDHGVYNAKSLCTQLRKQLNAASSETDFDVTQTEYDVNGNGLWEFRFRKASDNFDLYGTITTNAVWSMIGKTATDVTAQTDYTLEETRIHLYEWLLIDYGASNPDQVGLTDAAFRGYNFTSAVSFRVQQNASNSWSSPTENDLLTFDAGTTNRPSIMYLHRATATRRYNRLLIKDPKNTDGFVSLGIAYLGNSFELTDNYRYDGIVDGADVQEYINMTPTGNITGSVSSNLKTHSFSFTFLPEDTDRDNLEQLFDYAQRSRPFFVSFNGTVDTAHWAHLVQRPDFTRHIMFDDNWATALKIRDAA